MAYDNAKRISYSFGSVDFGDVTDVPTTITGPSGKKGRVVEVSCFATEIFTATTTEAAINIGSAAAGVQHANVGLGTLAANATHIGSATPGDIVDYAAGGASEIAADATVHVTLVATTGGVPTGIGVVTITIEWFN